VNFQEVEVPDTEPRAQGRMHIAALPYLASPQTGRRLSLQILSRSGDWIIDGILESSECWYPIIDGLPVFPSATLQVDLTEFCRKHGVRNGTSRAGDHSGQALTNLTFSHKWNRFTNYGLEPSHQHFLQGWYARKFGLRSAADLPAFFASFDTILEAGSGSGFNTRFMAEHCIGRVFALDISDAARVTMENTRELTNCHVVNADLFHAPFADETFDFVIADGVLHHTPSTPNAVAALYKKVKPGGQFFFYIYKKMGAARQFVDRHIRDRFTQLSPEACYAACAGITELGRELSRLNAQITLQRPIEALGIPAGTHDVQRLIYYNFLKCFWNEAFDFATNNMINFDWYHPHHAWQHEPEEVQEWLGALGIRDYDLNDANPNGISVLLRKPA